MRPCLDNVAIFRSERLNQVRADEPSSAGNDNPHGSLLPRSKTRNVNNGLRFFGVIRGKGNAYDFKPVNIAAERSAPFGNRGLEFAPLGLPRRVATTIFDDVVLKRRREIAFANDQAFGAVARAEAFDRPRFKDRVGAYLDARLAEATRC